MESPLSPYEIGLRDDAIARGLACGAPRERLCSLYDLTPAELRNIEVRRAGLVQQYREKLQLAQQLHEQFVHSLAPQALGNVETILRDPSHKQHAELSWKVVEKALPAQHLTVGGNVGLAMSEETAAQLADVLKALVAHKAEQPDAPSIEHDPRLIGPARTAQ